MGLPLLPFPRDHPADVLGRQDGVVLFKVLLGGGGRAGRLGGGGGQVPKRARISDNRDGLPLPNPVKERAFGARNLAEQHKSATAIHKGLQFSGNSLHVQRTKRDGNNQRGLVLPQNPLISVRVWIVIAVAEVLGGEHIRFDFVLLELSCERGQQGGVWPAPGCRAEEDNMVSVCFQQAQRRFGHFEADVSLNVGAQMLSDGDTGAASPPDD